MDKRFLSFASVGALVATLGFFTFASSAFAEAGIESVKLTGPNTITIVYSEPVYTSPSDYTDFTGSFSGENVESVDGSGSNTITLNLSGSVASSATGYLTIGSNVQDVSDSQYFPGSTWNIQDSIGPGLTSFTMSSNENNGAFSGTNDEITVSFDTNEQVSVESMTIAGHPISVNGGGTGPFTATYTMESSDNQQSIPVTVTIEDSQNNVTSNSFTFNTGTTATGETVTNGSVAIASIASNANTPGVLTNGNSITFTLTPTFNEPNAHITGSYNGQSLNWTTTNNGLNYVATYVVEPGQSSQTIPLQISGVTMTDQYGNVTAGASGYDIQKTINVTSAPVSTPTQTVTTPPTTTTTSDNSELATEIQSLENQLTSLESQTSNTSANTTASSQYDFTDFLSVGSENAQVTALQQQLTKDNIYSGPITGYFGTLTQTAVEQFQQDHDIAVKGYVGPSTRAALNAGN